MSDKHSALDWGLFAALTVIWASAYAMTRIAVQTSNPEMGLPVEIILPARLTIGAVVLHVCLLANGQRMPPFSHRRGWLFMALMGFFGMTLPFFFITTAQETVDSSLAALYTAAAPIFVAIGAHALFADERLTSRRVVGILVGFVGVGVLFGPDAIANWGSASVIAQVLLLIATGGYAISTIVARSAPPLPALAFTAGYVTFGALFSWPILIFADLPPLNPVPASIIAVIGLGVGPSALAALLYIFLVRRAGANFLALTGYSIPIVSAGMGWVFFGETQSWNAIAAFALILGGVWLAQRKSAQMPKTASES
ncbi:MAG: DMT family transporter [Pseudomonadota bacterium]